ncbi:MAG: 2-oxoglutarate dehydrogenase complex dihydrolipoyllysine-residue succinyltransferase [Planctomycetota bacterium]|nr:2-oxoglutarate dehydrogenase complex dihydrolipoyllysine-residue succinyltransferase [Planctomycetota bacterium]
MIEVKVPSVGESISEVQIGQWLKAEGEWVAADENLVDLETEKASVQVPSPASGYVRNVLKQTEDFAMVDEVICSIEPAEAPAGGTSTDAPMQPAALSLETGQGHVMPAAQRILEENGIAASSVKGSGPDGRILKEDAMAAVASKSRPASVQSPTKPPVLETSLTELESNTDGSRREEVKPLSMIRRTIAKRLVEAQQNAALLTTFNEVNMKPIMSLRKKYKDAFLDRHGVKLGFMSFFAKASVEALRRFPSVNAEIRGNNIVYRHFNDIGIAIGGGKGLVVPVLRNVEDMTFADVERTIGDFASKAMDNRLMPEDLEGGTFTISNGGVYGSLLSTPIVNAPQSAILGLHSIQERPMAVNGEVVVLPMMYVALSYDHRIIDGREAVSFLKTIKEVCEDPTRLFLEV